MMRLRRASVIVTFSLLAWATTASADETWGVVDSAGWERTP